jgi:hypothetical protein
MLIIMAFLGRYHMSSGVADINEARTVFIVRKKIHSLAEVGVLLSSSILEEERMGQV